MNHFYQKYVIIFMLFSFFLEGSLLFAGTTGKISGTIIDKSSREPLFGANITVLETELGAASDLDGNFSILRIPPGVYKVKVSYIGYQNVIIKSVQVKADQTTTLNIEMQPMAFEQEQVVVSAYRAKRIEPDRTSTKQIYLTKDLKTIAGINNVSNIIGLQADVVDDHFRGGRVGETNYLVNGVSIVNPITNGTAFNPMVSALEQVDVITSGFNAEYGNAQSGIVNMVMKRGGDKWQSSLFVEGDMPHYKHWGKSVYSPEVRHYDELFRNNSTWYTSPKNFGIDETQKFYQRGGGSEFIPSQFSFKGRKAAKALAFLAQQEYLLSQNEIGRNYFNAVDTRFDLTIGGPITKNLHLFLAGQLKNYQNKVPFYLPNKQYQLMGNLSYKIGDNDLRFQYMQSNKLDYGNYKVRAPYYSYDVKNYESFMKQSSLKWQHVLSSSTFFNISLGYFQSGKSTRSPLTAEGEGQGDYYNGLYTLVSGQKFPYVDAEYGLKKAETYSLAASVTSQLDFYNLIKAGLTFNYTHILSNLTTSANGSPFFGTFSPKDQVFDEYPYDGALYLQDKIEFEGIVLNMGFRWDFYNFNTEAFTDVVSPIRNPNFISISETPNESYYDESKAAKEKTKMVINFEPRFGISFPIGETVVFHANYGVFVQRPRLTTVYQRNRILSGNLVDYSYLGNPNLKPEETSAYDIGVVLGLPLDFTLDFSAYYKAVINLLAAGRYVDEQQKDYDTQINRDYANIQGFHVNLERTGEHMGIFIRYNWQEATGKSEGYSDDRTILKESVKYGPLSTSSTVTPEDEFMDYDRTHKIVANLVLKTGDLGGVIFNNLSFSATYRFMTGRPFTYDPSGLNLVKNKRTRNDEDLSFRIQKNISISHLSFSIYLDVFNVLNYKRLSFGYLTNVLNTQKYYDHAEGYAKDDFNRGDFWWDNSVSAYSNSPRYTRLGITVNF